MNAHTAPIPPIPDAAGATPVMAQFFEAKARQPDALVFFRMGDFYELFFEDAHKAAAAIGIALTHRGTHAGQPIPMAGVPAHAAEAYLAKLIRAGFKVAVCEQMEDPAEARKRGGKGIVRRDLVRMVTPEPRQCFLPICPASRSQRVSYPQLETGSPPPSSSLATRRLAYERARDAKRIHHEHLRVQRSRQTIHRVIGR